MCADSVYVCTCVCVRVCVCGGGGIVCRPVLPKDTFGVHELVCEMLTLYGEHNDLDYLVSHTAGCCTCDSVGC